MDELQPLTLIYLAAVLLAVAAAARHIRKLRIAIERETSARTRAKDVRRAKARFKQLAARRGTHRLTPTPQPWVVVPEHIGSTPPIQACEPSESDTRAAAVICSLSVPIDLLEAPQHTTNPGGSDVD